MSERLDKKKRLDKSIDKMKRAELERIAAATGLNNPSHYNVPELRQVLKGRLGPPL